jgi:chromosome segregation ATPase
MSQQWADKMLELLENDAQIEKQQAKQELEKLTLELTEIEQKLDRLLEAYLDTLIDSENYKQKKNELMEKQSNLKDKISQLKAGNLFWVESVKEFINCAQECAKSRCAKHDWPFGDVSSLYNLMEVKYKQASRALP